MCACELVRVRVRAVGRGGALGGGARAAAAHAAPRVPRAAPRAVPLAARHVHARRVGPRAQLRRGRARARRLVRASHYQLRASHFVASLITRIHLFLRSTTFPLMLLRDGIFHYPLL